jgi:phosphoglycerol transferase MdoB-like AlkP superfamily enzyme
VGTDISGKPKPFTGTKIAEHGGVTPADRNEPLVVAGPGISHRDDASAVSTAQVAPTILGRLDLDPQKLQAVVAERTQPLPGNLMSPFTSPAGSGSRAVGPA